MMKLRYVALILVIAIIIAFMVLAVGSPSKERVEVSSTEKGVSFSFINEVKITILVDNNPGREGLRTAWGFSALIEADGRKILFDSGPDPEVLKHNAKILGINLSDIDFIVLSHEHGDHTGGMPYLAEVAHGAKVYLPSGISSQVLERIKRLGFNVTSLQEPTELAPGIVTTGSMRGPPYEQGLIMVVKELGSILITGCAHPKIEIMIQRAANLTGRVYAVIGGFHLVSASDQRLKDIEETTRRLGVEKVFPMHCSGDKARSFFKQSLPERYGDGHVGMTLVFSAKGVSIIP